MIPKPTREEVELHEAYVVEHGADHDDDCPGDDTCECSFQPRNEAVDAVCRHLLTHRMSTDTKHSLHMIGQALDAYCCLTTHPHVGVDVLKSKQLGYRMMLNEIRAQLRGPMEVPDGSDGRG